MGAIIEGAGKETIHIQGVESLSPITHTIIPDRIEAGTFMVAAAITGGSIIMKNYPDDDAGVRHGKARRIGRSI